MQLEDVSIGQTVAFNYPIQGKVQVIKGNVEMIGSEDPAEAVDDPRKTLIGFTHTKLGEVQVPVYRLLGVL